MSKLNQQRVIQLSEALGRLDYLIEARDEVVDAAIVVWEKLRPKATSKSSDELEWKNGHLWIGLT